MVLPDAFLQRGWRKLYSHAIVCTLLHPALDTPQTTDPLGKPCLQLVLSPAPPGEEPSEQLSSACKGHFFGQSFSILSMILKAQPQSSFQSLEHLYARHSEFVPAKFTAQLHPCNAPHIRFFLAHLSLRRNRTVILATTRSLLK